MAAEPVGDGEDSLDVPASRAAPGPFRSRWHLAPAGTLLFGGLTVGLIELGRPEPLRPVAFAFVFASIVCSVLSLYCFWIEGRRLEDAGAAWTPRWWIYAGVHLLMSPFLGAAVYLVQRWRHVGLGSGSES